MISTKILNSLQISVAIPVWQNTCGNNTLRLSQVKLVYPRMAHRKRIYTEFIDPIQILIDKQLASLWIEAVYVWKVGKNHRWSKLVDGDRSSLNYIEDMMVEALDRKYHSGSKTSDLILEFSIQGYTAKEISLITGIPQRTVERYLQILKEKGTKIDEGN